MAGVLASRGGHGGGSLILEAGQINIYGKIIARGADGLISSGVGSGGGAGGEVRLIANEINWGPNSLVSVAGGIGGGGSLTKIGGSGGGGLVHVQGGPQPPPTSIDVKGGASAKEGCGLGAGADGQFVLAAGPATCVDLDGDGQPSQGCGGSDCDDADDKISPNAEEVCDGVDNDCDGMVDGKPELCGTGNTCQGGKCVATSDAGVEDGGAVPPSLTQFEYAGGCTVGSAEPSGSIAALAGLLGVLGVRRRARSPGKLAALLRRR
ncbi:putative metal-binding motif-containing protein [Polyangium aurulentum]|nr:putative metal-binding motif-containing protein [Polyangium aurulentum]